MKQKDIYLLKDQQFEVERHPPPIKSKQSAKYTVKLVHKSKIGLVSLLGSLFFLVRLLFI